MPDICKTNLCEKFEETHYERFTRTAKELLGVSPMSLVELSRFKHQKVNELDDTIYQAVALSLMNSFFALTSKRKDYTVDEVYKEGGMLLGVLRSYMHSVYHTYKFSKQRMIFQFEEGLTAKLLHTDLKKIDSCFLTSPYESIFIKLPESCSLKVPDHEGLHNAAGIYVSYIQDVDVEDLKIIQKGSTEGYADAQFNFKGNRVDKFLKVLVVGEEDKRGYTPTFFMVLPLAKGDIFEQIRAALLMYSDGSTVGYEGQVEHIYSFVINALLYISSPSADLQRIKAKYPKVKKGKKKKANVDGFSRLDVISTGATIKLSKSFREQYASGALTNNVISVPVWMVRGHWRNQAYGPQMALRRLQWIEPYSKGRGIEAGLEAPGRSYEVD